MPMKVRYTTLQGEIVSELRHGVGRDYVPDPLGSTVALLDANQNKTDTFSYWPYGELKSRTGTTPTPMQYVGTRGYYRDKIERVYVRARHVHASLGRWLTRDRLGICDSESAYALSADRPTSLADPSGDAPRRNCRLTFTWQRSATEAKLCLQHEIGGAWANQICWDASSGGYIRKDKTKARPIPRGCWCFHDWQWLDLGTMYDNPNWGKGQVCMRLRVCPSDRRRMRRDNPGRDLDPGNFCLHGGRERDTVTDGCISIRSAEIEQLKKLLRNCKNYKDPCFELKVFS